MLHMLTVDVATSNGSSGLTDISISGFEEIVFSAQVDSVRATGDSEILVQSGGKDIADAAVGDDIVFGGAGNDTILGGNDDDTLSGVSGDDETDGGDDEDVVRFGHTSPGGAKGERFSRRKGASLSTSPTARPSEAQSTTTRAIPNRSLAPLGTTSSLATKATTCFRARAASTDATATM